MDKREVIQEEILNSLPPIAHGLLKLSPRVGKTNLTIKILNKEQCQSILWITPNTKLRDIEIPEEFRKRNSLSLLSKIKIICWASLEEEKGTYDKVVLDEYQFITEKNAKPLLDGSINYNSIIGLSGTHPRHREKLDILRSLHLFTLSEMSIDEAVDEEVIADYDILTIGFYLDNKDKYIAAGNKNNPFFQTEAARYNYLTKRINDKKSNGFAIPKQYIFDRLRFIYTLKSKEDITRRLLSQLKGRTLIFTGGIEQAERICENTYHSKTDDKKLKLFLQRGIDILACVNAGGIGFTFEGVDNFIITQVNSDAKGDTTQKICRALVLQENYKAKIIILYAKNTVDEEWKNKALQRFNPNNIKDSIWN